MKLVPPESSCRFFCRLLHISENIPGQTNVGVGDPFSRMVSEHVHFDVANNIINKKVLLFEERLSIFSEDFAPC